MTFLYPLVVVAIAVASLPAAHADLVHETFVLSTSEGAVDGNGSFYTSTKHGLMVDGVSFTAKLTVAASHEIETYTQGFGVHGSDPFHQITSGEYLTFSMELLNITGGDVNFDGFTGIDYDLFDSGDEVYLSGDASVATTDDNQPVLQGPQDVVDLSSWMPTVFSSIASPGAENLNAHLISSVTARFSSGLAAVPEPSGFLFGGLVTLLCGAVGRRGKRA